MPQCNRRHPTSYVHAPLNLTRSTFSSLTNLPPFFPLTSSPLDLTQPTPLTLNNTSLTARLSRGDSTDTQPLTTGEWEEIQHERDLAAAIPTEMLTATKREALSERDAIMLGAKSRIEDLVAKGKTDEQKIGALEKENERLGGENERLMGELEGQGKGRDCDSDEERAELRLENWRMREEVQGMTE
jgi:hypothetical protein